VYQASKNKKDEGSAKGGEKGGDAYSILVSETRDEGDEPGTSIEPEVGHTPLCPSHGGALCRFVSGSNTWGSGDADIPAPGSC